MRLLLTVEFQNRSTITQISRVDLYCGDFPQQQKSLINRNCLSQGERNLQGSHLRTKKAHLHSRFHNNGEIKIFMKNLDISKNMTLLMW